MFGSNRAQWGWHCLTDRYAEEIVDAANIAPNDLVLDVGAGNGALTAPLAATGARVIAIELHANGSAELRRRFESNSKVKVVRADGADLWLPRRPFHVVSNPPFAITPALLKRLLSPASQMRSAQLVLQRGATRRHVVAINKGTGRFQAHIGRLLPRSAFNPPPSVDTAVLVVHRAYAVKRRRYL